MSEILLQTIVEKLESIEIALLKENSVKNPELEILLKEIELLQREIARLPLKLEESSEKVNELLKIIRGLNFHLNRPTNEQIKHSHHLHKGIWISIGLLIISFLILFGWINCYNAKKAFEENDIKYRSLKVNDNISLLKLLYQTDSLYELNNDFFGKRVLKKEEDLAEREKLLRLTSGNKSK